MRVLVCGSRDWGRPTVISRRFELLRDEHEHVAIIHGAASRKRRGIESSADMLADHFARYYGFVVQPFPADWEKHGKRAGILRNLQMLDEQPDLVLAFQRDGSRGTQHTIDEARRRGIPVEVHTA
jgi:SLOG family YspA-like protein